MMSTYDPNGRIGADLRLGSITIGTSYIMAINIRNGINLKSSTGLFGTHILIWL